MTYLAFDFDAKTRCPQVARAADLSTGEVCWGLLELWEFCWRGKTDEVSDVQLSGFFPASTQLKPALEAFGFIERAESSWRIKGASRYLRVRKAQSDAGKKASKNLRQFTGSPPARAGVEPEVDLRISPALTASSEQRAASSELKASAVLRKGRKTTAPVDERHAPTVKALCDAYRDQRGAAYGFSARDAKAVSSLLALGEPPEIDLRWRMALAHTGFPSVATLSELVTNWNHFGGSKSVDITKGVAPVGDFSHLAPGEWRIVKDF